MTIVEVISISLAVIAICQAKRYKDMSDKAEKDKVQLLRQIENMTKVNAVMTRSIDNKRTDGSTKINLGKDKLQVLKNSRYKVSNASTILEKMEKELPLVLKQTYIDSIARFLEDDKESIEVVLRHQYQKEEVKDIEYINKIFEEDGLTFNMILN